MMYVERSQPEPPELAQERLKENGEYGIEAVLQRLNVDFHGRCYLCEAAPQEIHIDHLVPHAKNDGVRLLWANLFLSCSRCNNIKSEAENILDCTIDPLVEQRLHYHTRQTFREEFEIRALDASDDSAVATARLLNEIFNAETVNKALSGNALRREIVQRMARLFNLVNNYDDPAKTAESRRDDIEEIKLLLSPNARFASFMRCAMRDNVITLRKLKQDIAGLPL